VSAEGRSVSHRPAVAAASAGAGAAVVAADAAVYRNG